MKYTGAAHCGRRTCPGYNPLWLGDQRARILNNLVAYGGDVGMVTVTAPGQDVLPWDLEHCGHQPGECGGPKGCRVQVPYARLWNSGADKRWSALHDAASAAVRRKHGPGALQLLAYSTEMQARGVIHLHLVVGVHTARERAAAHHYVNNLSRLAATYAFGYVDRGHSVPRRGAPRRLRIRPALAAGEYISKYLVKEQSAGGIGELVMSGYAPRRPVYVANRLTMRSRCTMRNLRVKRALYVLTRQSVTCRDAEMLWRAMQTFSAQLDTSIEVVPQTASEPPPGG